MRARTAVFWTSGKAPANCWKVRVWLLSEELKRALSTTVTDNPELPFPLRRLYLIGVLPILLLLIAAVVLYFLGSGPVQGFAVTLALGILTSLFTSYTVTLYFVGAWYR